MERLLNLYAGERGITFPAVPLKTAPGIGAAAYYAVSDTIRLDPDVNRDVLFGSYVHELTHAMQRRRYGLAGYLLRKTFQRSALEEEAKAAELDATAWAGDYRIREWQQKNRRK